MKERQVFIMTEQPPRPGKKAVDWAKYNHTERKRQQKREYSKRNRDKLAAYQKEYYHEHHDEQVAYHQKHRQENPEMYQAIAARQRARDKQRRETDPVFARKFKYGQARSGARTFLNKHREIAALAPEQYLTDLQLFERRIDFLLARLAGHGDTIESDALKFPRIAGLPADYRKRVSVARRWLIDPNDQEEAYQTYLLEDQGATYAKDLKDYQTRIATVIKALKGQPE